MRTWRVASCVALTACGLHAVGERSDVDGGAPSSASSGSASSASSGGVTCATDLGAPNAVIVASGACPEGTNEQSILQTDPKAGAGACTCGDCTATSSLCAGPNFVWHWAGDMSCSPSNATYNVPNDGACVPVTANVDVQIDYYNRWTRDPIPGTCDAPKVVDAQKVLTTTLRQCVPNAATFCRAASDRVCVPGDPAVACSAAFPVALVVGDGPKLECGDCACTRTATACHIEYHDDATCTNKVSERDADGQCLATMRPKMYTIKMYPKNPTCSKTPGPATASLTNSRTLCCTQ